MEQPMNENKGKTEHRGGGGGGSGLRADKVLYLLTDPAHTNSGYRRMRNDPLAKDRLFPFGLPAIGTR